MNTIKIYPKCHPYNFDADAPVPPQNEWRRQKSYVYNSLGYLMPCCWCSWASSKKDIEAMGLLDESLKVENVNSLSEIIISKQWVNFHRTLIEEPEKAPSVCKEKCTEYPTKKSY
jgi:hypothetical protein